MECERNWADGLRGLVAACTVIVGLIVAVPAAAQVDSYTVGVDGMACPFCAYGIEKKLTELEGVASIDIHIKKGTVDVNLQKEATVTPDQIQSAIESAGFGLRALRIRGTATFEKRDGEILAKFSDELTLPVATGDVSDGQSSVTGEVLRKGESWVLELAGGGGTE